MLKYTPPFFHHSAKILSDILNIHPTSEKYDRIQDHFMVETLARIKTHVRPLQKKKCLVTSLFTDWGASGAKQ